VLLAPAVFIYDCTNMLRLLYLLCLGFLTVVAGSIGVAQSVGKAAPDLSVTAEKATKLAEDGHCRDALPLLRRSLGHVKDKELGRKVSVDGARCAMTLHQSDAALAFLTVLQREFPDDPDALYVAVHAYSDLATEASQTLARNASSSFQAHELMAESYESQSKWGEAEKEYRRIAAQNPKLPGIHFRIGRLLLSKNDPSPEDAEAAKKEMQQEIEIDPSNPGAEYVLGAMAKQNEEWDEAIQHFSRAAKLDPGFGDAFVGWGGSLVSEKKFSEAIPPLETAVRLQTGDPAAHYMLAVAYSRSGRKEEGEREFAIQQKLTQKGAAGEAPTDPQPKPN
jgi:tetratricopeptide (TPR) repeat protein